MAKTEEERLIERYFQAFNDHDLDGVMACFHDHPIVVESHGNRRVGREAVRALYVEQLSFTPDGRCDLSLLVGHDGSGVAESAFHGTLSGDGRVIRAVGVEVFEFADGRIKELRNYHRLVE